VNIIMKSLYILLLSFVLFSCASTVDELNLGKEGDKCFDNNTCRNDLICIDDKCILDKCIGVTCLNLWEKCSYKDGICHPQPGFCSTDNDCEPVKEYCNQEHLCKTKVCTPKTCDEINAECGEVDDGCGSSLKCGDCSKGFHCNNDNSCVSDCRPDFCTDELNRSVCKIDENGLVTCLCDDGYHDEGGNCVLDENCDGITCVDDSHCEEGECVLNSKDIPCTPSTDHPDEYYRDIGTSVIINWTEENGWETAAECEWECDEGFHLFTNPDIDLISCVFNTQNTSCESNGDDLPENAIEDTNSLVTATWVFDESKPAGGYWFTPKCSWICDTDISCLSSDETYCILKEDNDICDGEDNNCDGIIDNKDDGEANSSCASGDCFGKIYNEHRYMFCNSIMKNWNDSESECVNYGGHLVSINDVDENSFIKNNANGKCWIGYYQTDNTNSAPWHWINGDESSYNNWLNGEPSNTCVDSIGCVAGNGDRENHAEMYPSGKWNDEDDKNEKRFICEFTE